MKNTFPFIPSVQESTQSSLNRDLYAQSLDLYEEKKYIQAFHTLLDCLNPDCRKKFGNIEGTEFHLPNGKSRKTKSDGREKRKAIFEAKTKCAQKSRLLPPSGQNTSVVQTPFESCLKDAFLLNFLLKYHLKTHCQFSKKSYLYIVVMLPLCIPSRPHS